MESLTSSSVRGSANRRDVLRLAGLGGASWLTTVANVLAREEEQTGGRQRARALIMLWLAGGPSQLETFDPHPGTDIAAGTRAIDTAARGVQLAEGLEKTAAVMHSLSLVRSLVSKEGDHERGTYLVKTGYRPDPTVAHPSIGAVICHANDAVDLDANRIARSGIPRHISILPGQWPARGGYLGQQYDAFKTYDPARPVPDVIARVSDERTARRMANLQAIEREFSQGRQGQVDRTRHQAMIAAARKLMSAEQLTAFDVSQESEAVRAAYGDTEFGRGCLAARRLVATGVRCVEVTLGGWDTHLNNHATHRELLATLDPALAALLTDLNKHELLEQTAVVCGGEFGRTPRINAANGRDHWPHGFSMALAGGGIRGGLAVGRTDPAGGKKVEDAHQVADVHATVLAALGIDYREELTTPVGRPLKLSTGEPIRQLLG